MSKQEMVDAYLQGNISRRTFVRRLAAAGLTLSAAIGYAELLRPGRAHAGTPGHKSIHRQEYYGGDFYGDYYGCPDYYGRPRGASSPTVTTEDPVEVTQSTVRARALVDANNARTSAWFEIRPTGWATWSEIQSVDIACDQGRALSIVIGGLQPSTSYDIRGAAKNFHREPGYGEIKVFMTAAASSLGAGDGGSGGAPASGATFSPFVAGGTPAPVVPPKSRNPGIRLGRPSSLSTAHRTGIISIPVVVDQDATLRVYAKKGVRKSRKLPFVAASTSLVNIAAPVKTKVKAGTPQNVKLRLDRTGRRLLKGNNPVRVLFEVHAVNGDGLKGLLRSTLHVKD
jgi:hypothetical protein